MKPWNARFFLLFLICFTVTYCLGQSATVEMGGQHLTQRQSSLFKEQCQLAVARYYNDLNYLLGANLKDEDREASVASTTNDCFRTPDVMIENSIPVIHEDKVDVQHYLGAVSISTDSLDYLDLDGGITLSDIYYNEQEHFYYVIATVTQSTVVRGKKSKGKLDIELSFNPSTKLKTKIFSIQKHTDEIIKKPQPVTIDATGQIQATAPNSQALAFDIAPADADVYIDGKNWFNDGKEINVEPGEHKIKVIAPNYQSLRLGVFAGSSGLIEVKCDLKPDFGYLAITADSADKGEDITFSVPRAQIRGKLPLSNYQLPARSYTVEINESGHGQRVYPISIKKNESTTLTISTTAGLKCGQDEVKLSHISETSVSFKAFYDSLSQYGYWVQDPKYGYVWVPTAAGSNFKPYFTNGHWSMSNLGNIWVSADPWSWAVFHYGRWTYNNYYKWVWVPGYEWAPAWVSWRAGKEICGWAPLSPDLAAGVSNACPNSWWVFVKLEFLYNPEYSKFADLKNDGNFIAQTELSNNCVESSNPDVAIKYNFGPSADDVEEATKLRVMIKHLLTLPSPLSPVPGSDMLGVYRPDLRSVEANSSFPPAVILTSRPLEPPQEVDGNTDQSAFIQDIGAHKLVAVQIVKSSQ